jgi:hypothetical protein
MLKYITLCCFSLTAFGQIENRSSLNLYLDIRPFISLEVSVGSGNLNYEFNNFDVISTGITKSNAFWVRIKSNQNWQMSVSTLSTHFNDVNNGQQSGIPSDALRLKKGNGSYIPLTVSRSPIASGGRGGSQNSRNNFGLDMQALIGPNHQSGNYIIDVVFTITAD